MDTLLSKDKKKVAHEKFEAGNLFFRSSLLERLKIEARKKSVFYLYFHIV